MAIANYTDLSASIAAWLHRTDLAAVIPDFIRLAESRMQMDLEVRQLESTAILTTTGGTSTVALPSDLNQIRALSTTASGITTVLDKMPMNLLLTRYSTSAPAIPHSYAIQGANLLLAPTPNSTYTIALDYFANITGLSALNATNVILTNYPDLYLHACLIYAGQYTRDGEMVQGMEALYSADLSRININNWGQMGSMSMKQG